MNKMYARILFALLCCLVSLGAFSQLVQVQGLYETDNVTSYNSADDPAIYLHPRYGDSSFFIGTDKQGSGRLELYDLDGTRFWHTPTGTSMNNVDVLYGFVLGGDTIDIVGATAVTFNDMEFYRVDDTARNLVDITGNTATGLFDMYGFAFYKDVCNKKYYAFLTLKNSSGFVYQYELTDNGNGQIDATLVRQILNLPTRTEGIAADQTLGYLYVAEESVGIWKYLASPAGGTSRVLMDSVGGAGHLTAAVEGITIYYATDSTGYIIAVSQEVSTYQVYDRAGNNAFLGEFEIIAGTVSDAYKADGIEVLAYPMGSVYPYGVFITHDNAPTGEYTNYMTVPWERIADSLGLEIAMHDPRTIGDTYCADHPAKVPSLDNLNSKITVYPNPFRNEIKLDWEGQAHDLEVEIVDALGKVLWKGVVSKNESINLDQLSQGSYFVKSSGQIIRIVNID